MEKVTKEAYRKYLAETLDDVNESIFENISKRKGSTITLYALQFELTRELYKLDNEKENIND